MTTCPQQIAALAGAGAHIVLCAGKRPVGRWSAPATETAIRRHRGRYGIVPHSLGYTVLDVDAGDWRRDLPTPAAVLRSRAGEHLWYRDPVARGNARWRAGEAAGDVRGARGYVVLWDEAAAHKIMDAPDGAPLPHYALNLPPPRRKSHREIGLAAAATSSPGPGRNTALYRALWSHCAASPIPDDPDEWVAAVLEVAHAINRGFEDPLDDDEVRSCAYYRAARAAEWRDAQSWRACRRAWSIRWRHRHRDAAITRAALSGESQRSLAARHGLSRGAITRILRRQSSERAAIRG